MSRYNMNMPEGWHRMEQHCYPRDGSKAYKSDTTKANIHVVDLYGSGAYNVNGEDKNGDIYDETFHDYHDALAAARGWMLMEG